MRSDRAWFALLDIRDNILLARQFVVGTSEAAFAEDRRTFYAVARCPEVISEAARRLPPSVRNRHPDLPWRAIMGAGNVYLHDYDNVAEDIVWRTVEGRLAPLLAAVESEIARLSEGSRRNRLRERHRARPEGLEFCARAARSGCAVQAYIS